MAQGITAVVKRRAYCFKNQSEITAVSDDSLILVNKADLKDEILCGRNGSLPR